MKKNYPLVSVIVVNYNGKKFLKNCFDSLLKVNFPEDKLELILVDNGSKDGSCNFIKKNYKNIRIIKNKENNYSKALNIGIKKSKGELIAFLNNDTTVDKNWLIALVEEILKDKSVGAVGSKILFSNGKINSAGMVEFPNFYVNHRGFNEIDKGQYNEKKFFDYLSGAAILFKKKCLEEIDVFDEDFTFYYDEIDFEFRCKHKWKLVYVPKSIVYHEFCGTMKYDSENFKYHIERSRLLFVAKHFPKRLPSAITSSHLFYKNIKKEHELLFKIVPDILKKLVKENEKEVLLDVLPELFKELRKIIDFEKYDHLKELLKENKDLKRKLSKESNELLKKDKKLSKKSKELSKKDKELKRIYNSRAYKWFISHIWNVHSKVFKENK